MTGLIRLYFCLYAIKNPLHSQNVYIYIYEGEVHCEREKCTRVRINWWIELEINCSQRKELFVDIDLSVSVIL